MDGQEQRERPEGETGDLGKRGNGWKDRPPGSLRESGGGVWGAECRRSRVGSDSRGQYSTESSPGTWEGTAS